MKPSTKELFDLLHHNEKKVQKNISTFTSVHTHPLVEKFLLSYTNKNFVDRKAYASLAASEEIIRDFFQKLYKNESGRVILTSGSTESILVSLYNARENARQSKNNIKPNIVLSELAHYSFFKAAKLLGIEARTVKVADDLTINVQEAEKQIDTNTILLIGIMGTTEIGTIDDLKALDRLAGEYSVPLHVDAAIGGFIIPFLENTNVPYTFDDLKNLVSLNISGHKFGLSLPGCGILLMREDALHTNENNYLSYLSSGKNRIDSILITSSALGAFSLAVNISEYGVKGYQGFTETYLQTKSNLIEELESTEIEYFTGSPYLPQIFIYNDQTQDLSDFLSEKGWLQSAYEAKGLHKLGIRIVIKKEQEHAILHELVQDLKTFNTNMQQNVNANQLYKFTPNYI